MMKIRNKTSHVTQNPTEIDQENRRLDNSNTTETLRNYGLKHIKNNNLTSMDKLPTKINTSHKLRMSAEMDTLQSTIIEKSVS